MKRSPYEEYIDINSERKEYALLCDDKSTKYKLYTEWEDHIKETLSIFKSSQDLYNFKRYCMNKERTFSKTPEMFAAYIILFLTVFIDEVSNGLPQLGLLLLLFLALIYIIRVHKRMISESYFFHDVINIIEKFENSSDSKL